MENTRSVTESPKKNTVNTFHTKMPPWLTHRTQCTTLKLTETQTRIQYKMALVWFHTVSGTAPPYLSELLHLCSPSRSLRTAADTRIFRVPRMGRRTLGETSFQCNGPVIWNSLPLSVRHSSSLSSLRSKLKTHLLSSTY